MFGTRIVWRKRQRFSFELVIDCRLQCFDPTRFFFLANRIRSVMVIWVQSHFPLRTKCNWIFEIEDSRVEQQKKSLQTQFTYHNWHKSNCLPTTITRKNLIESINQPMDSWNQFFIIRKTWMWILHFVLNSMICYWMNEWIKSELCWHRSSLRVGCATSFIEIYKHMVQLVAKMANGSICLEKKPSCWIISYFWICHDNF